MQRSHLLQQRKDISLPLGCMLLKIGESKFRTALLVGGEREREGITPPLSTLFRLG